MQFNANGPSISNPILEPRCDQSPVIQPRSLRISMLAGTAEKPSREHPRDRDVGGLIQSEIERRERPNSQQRPAGPDLFRHVSAMSVRLAFQLGHPLGKPTCL